MKSSSMPIFKKLNLGEHTEIAVFNAPKSFEGELAQLKSVKILRDPKKPKGVTFSLAFATKQVDVDRLSAIIAAAAEGDAVVWFAYPKGTSKRHTCDFNRDTGWRVLRQAGFDTVRAVAIDEDWSALRFRRVQYVKASR